jgi:hypothetical protein
LEKNYNVDIDKDHTNNGAFRTVIFQKEIDSKVQNISFSGANAQWQNGLVDRSNGTLCAAARSMFNHAISKWEQTLTPELWHLAIQHAAIIFNTTERRSRNYEENKWENFTGKDQN